MITILKNTPTHAVVAVVGSGATTETLDIDTLAIAGTQTASSPIVNIKAIQYSVPATQSGTITRNGSLLWSVSSSDHLKFDGFVDNRQNASDIVFGLTGGGTIIVELIKVSGYGDTQHINPT